MPRRAAIVLLALLCASAPRTARSENPPDLDLALFLELFEGEFNNAEQAERDRAALAAGEITEPDVHPWHHHTVRRVEAPKLGRLVYFSQINAEGPDGAVVRQRVNVLEPDPGNGVIRQRFFGLEGREKPATADEVAGMTPDGLRAYPAGCEVVWRRDGIGYRGTIAPGDCRVVSQRSGTPLLIVAELGLTPDGATHLEGGLDEAHEPVFGPPGGKPFELDRVR